VFFAVIRKRLKIGSDDSNHTRKTQRHVYALF